MLSKITSPLAVSYNVPLALVLHVAWKLMMSSTKTHVQGTSISEQVQAAFTFEGIAFDPIHMTAFALAIFHANPALFYKKRPLNRNENKKLMKQISF